jgi:hypothetical protein
VELLTLTRPETFATQIPIAEAGAMLEKARADFPEYRLEIEPRGEWAVIRTEARRGRRWLRT